MKVLFVSAWWPFPPDNGSRIRVFNLMKALSVKHDVHLVSLLQDDSDPSKAERFSGICTVLSTHPMREPRAGAMKSVANLLGPRPLHAALRFDRSVVQSLSKAVDNLRPDVIVAATLGVAEYVDPGWRIPSVLDEHNCEFAVLRRSAERLEGALRRLRGGLTWRKNMAWEVGICRRYSAVVMVSEDDVAQMLRAAPTLRNPCVVPNGVDTEHYDPAAWDPEPRTLIYNGALTYGANRDAVAYFASEVLPLLRMDMPDVMLGVTGRTQGVDLAGIADAPGVSLTGYVEDIRAVLARSAACVVPLREGGGSRLKILEAMAAGVPVVSTTMGAEGIDVVAGRHLLIADSPEEMARAVRSVLTDQTVVAALRREARSLVEERYSWTAIGGRFREVIEDVAGNVALGQAGGQR